MQSNHQDDLKRRTDEIAKIFFDHFGPTYVRSPRKDDPMSSSAEPETLWDSTQLSEDDLVLSSAKPETLWDSTRFTLGAFYRAMIRMLHAAIRSASTDGVLAYEKTRTQFTGTLTQRAIARAKKAQQLNSQEASQARGSQGGCGAPGSQGTPPSREKQEEASGVAYIEALLEKSTSV